MREFTCEHEIAKSAEEFWSYRLDLDFDRIIASADGQDFSVERYETSKDAEGHEIVDRDVRLTFKKNPVPKSLQSMLKDPQFAFNVSARWYTSLFDEAHAMSYSIKLPVFSDRITVDGWQWAEPLTATSCKLCCRVQLSVTRLPAISSKVAKGIVNGMLDAYRMMPQRVEEYARLRAKKLAAAGVPPPLLPPPRSADDGEEARGSAPSSEEAREAAEEAAAEAAEEVREAAVEAGGAAREAGGGEEELGLPSGYDGVLLTMREKTLHLRLALQQAERDAERQELLELRKYITENKTLRESLEMERLRSAALEHRLLAVEKALAQERSLGKAMMQQLRLKSRRSSMGGGALKGKPANAAAWDTTTPLALPPGLAPAASGPSAPAASAPELAATAAPPAAAPAAAPPTVTPSTSPPQLKPAAAPPTVGAIAAAPSAATAPAPGVHTTPAAPRVTPAASAPGVTPAASAAGIPPTAAAPGAAPTAAAPGVSPAAAAAAVPPTAAASGVIPTSAPKSNPTASAPKGNPTASAPGVQLSAAAPMASHTAAALEINPAASGPGVNPTASAPRANPAASAPRANPDASAPRANPTASAPRANPTATAPRANPTATAPEINPAAAASGVGPNPPPRVGPTPPPKVAPAASAPGGNTPASAPKPHPAASAPNLHPNASPPLRAEVGDAMQPRKSDITEAKDLGEGARGGSMSEVEAMLTEQVEEESPLQDLLRSIEGGEYADDVLVEHLHLGPQVLLFTDERMIYFNSQSPSKQWQAQWERLKGVDISADHSRVSLLLFPGGGRERFDVDCGHVAAMHLVYATIRRMRELHAQAVVMTSLSNQCSSPEGSVRGSARS